MIGIVITQLNLMAIPTSLFLEEIVCAHTSYIASHDCRTLTSRFSYLANLRISPVTPDISHLLPCSPSGSWSLTPLCTVTLMM